MRPVVPALALALVAVVAVVDLRAPTDDTPAPATAPAATTGLDHVDDYDAPVEVLIDHADHLDFSRLDPQKRAAVEAELARRRDEATALWTAYGELVGAGQGSPPPARIDAAELGYLLLAARAEQLADEVARAGTLPAALGDHPEVTVTEQDGCVTVSWSQDPFARAFGARVAARSGGELRERLVQRVTVGAVEDPPCQGQPPAFSPQLEGLLTAS